MRMRGSAGDEGERENGNERSAGEEGERENANERSAEPGCDSNCYQTVDTLT